MKSYRRILKYITRFKKFAFLNISFNFLYAIFNLFSFLMIIPFLNVLFGEVDKPGSAPAFEMNLKTILDLLNYRFATYVESHGNVSGLILICMLVVGVFLVKNIFRYLALYFLAPLRLGVVRDLRLSLFEKILQLPMSYFSEKRKGDIMARTSTDISEIEWSIMNTIESTFRDPLLILFCLISMLVMSLELTLFVFIFLPITGFIIGRIGKSLKRKSTRSQDHLGLLLSIVEESLSGLRVIKAFNAERPQKAKFFRENRVHYNLMRSVFNRRDLSSPLTEFLSICIVALILWFGGRIVLSHETALTGSTFIAYIIIFGSMINPIKSFANSYYYIQRGVASLDRVENILNADIHIKENPSATSIKSFEQNIEYRDVSFNYEEDTRVLHNINLNISKGKMIAVVGPSGSGKSTFADLLSRFYDPTVGEIRIDGIDIRDLRIASLRRLLGVVTQESILFNDTVFNNIAFGIENANEEDVIKAAKVANAYDFIMKLENGFQTIIGDRGSKLSGGERQRLTIARAIFKNPPILILDEATSSLDTESEKLVQDALFKLMQNRTSIVIAHRLSTIQFADEIIVMQEGRIVERGNHNALIAKNGLYARLVDMQAF